MKHLEVFMDVQGLGSLLNELVKDKLSESFSSEFDGIDCIEVGPLLAVLNSLKLKSNDNYHTLLQVLHNAGVPCGKDNFNKTVKDIRGLLEKETPEMADFLVDTLPYTTKIRQPHDRPSVSNCSSLYKVRKCNHGFGDSSKRTRSVQLATETRVRKKPKTDVKFYNCAAPSINAYCAMKGIPKKVLSPENVIKDMSDSLQHAQPPVYTGECAFSKEQENGTSFCKWTKTNQQLLLNIPKLLNCNTTTLPVPLFVQNKEKISSVTNQQSPSFVVSSSKLLSCTGNTKDTVCQPQLDPIRNTEDNNKLKIQHQNLNLEENNSNNTDTEEVIENKSFLKIGKLKLQILKAKKEIIENKLEVIQDKNEIQSINHWKNGQSSIVRQGISDHSEKSSIIFNDVESEKNEKKFCKPDLNPEKCTSSHTISSSEGNVIKILGIKSFDKFQKKIKFDTNHLASDNSCISKPSTSFVESSDKELPSIIISRKELCNSAHKPGLTYNKQHVKMDDHCKSFKNKVLVINSSGKIQGVANTTAFIVVNNAYEQSDSLSSQTGVTTENKPFIIGNKTLENHVNMKGKNSNHLDVSLLLHSDTCSQCQDNGSEVGNEIIFDKIDNCSMNITNDSSIVDPLVANDDNTGANYGFNMCQSKANKTRWETFGLEDHFSITECCDDKTCIYLKPNQNSANIVKKALNPLQSDNFQSQSNISQMFLKNELMNSHTLNNNSTGRMADHDRFFRTELEDSKANGPEYSPENNSQDNIESEIQCKGSKYDDLYKCHPVEVVKLSKKDESFELPEYLDRLLKPIDPPNYKDPWGVQSLEKSREIILRTTRTVSSKVY